MTRIVVDAMGSDEFPTPDVEGSVQSCTRIRGGDHFGRRRSQDQTRAGGPKPRQSTHPDRSRARDVNHGGQGRES